MDWLFKNQVSPLELSRTETEADVYQTVDLEQLFLQYEDNLLSEAEFKKILDKTADLLIRSRVYVILDAPGGGVGDTSMTPKSNDCEVTAADVLNSLCYDQRDGSALAYNLCLEYLAKSNLKFANSTNKRKSPKKVKNSNPSLGFRRYLRKISGTKTHLVLRLRSLTKRVKFLRQNLENVNLAEEQIPSSLSSSSDDIGSSSCIGDYETEDPCNKRHSRKHVIRGRKLKVPYRYYNSRRQSLLELEWRSKKSRRRKIGNKNLLWPVDCCSEKPQLRTNRNVRLILEYSVKALFLFICIRVLMDALQFNEHFEDSDFRSV